MVDVAQLLHQKWWILYDFASSGRLRAFVLLASCSLCFFARGTQWQIWHPCCSFLRPDIRLLSSLMNYNVSLHPHHADVLMDNLHSKCSNKTKSPGSQGPSPSCEASANKCCRNFWLQWIGCWDYALLVVSVSQLVFQHGPQRLVGARCYYHGIIVLVVSRLVPSLWSTSSSIIVVIVIVIAIIMVLVHFQNLASKKLGYLKFSR